METELSFLLTLLLEHKLPKGTKELVKDRIKVIQGNQPVTRQAPQMVTSSPSQGNIEAFSTPIPPRIVGGEVSTGAGTKGPRKW